MRRYKETGKLSLSLSLSLSHTHTHTHTHKCMYVCKYVCMYMRKENGIFSKEQRIERGVKKIKITSWNIYMAPRKSQTKKRKHDIWTDTKNQCFPRATIIQRNRDIYT